MLQHPAVYGVHRARDTLRILWELSGVSHRSDAISTSPIWHRVGIGLGLSVGDGIDLCLGIWSRTDFGLMHGGIDTGVGLCDVVVWNIARPRVGAIYLGLRTDSAETAIRSW